MPTGIMLVGRLKFAFKAPPSCNTGPRPTARHKFRLDVGCDHSPSIDSKARCRAGYRSKHWDSHAVFKGGVQGELCSNLGFGAVASLAPCVLGSRFAACGEHLGTG